MTFLRTTVAAAVLVLSLSSAVARGQGLTGEIDVTGGVSTEHDTAAAATQARLFGELPHQLRINVEGTWATRSSEGTDAFGAAYPYAGKVQLSEVYAERIFRRGDALIGVRAGQYRTPFGISMRSDYAYQGFLRAPLMRYDDYWSVSNNFLERGVDVVAGTSRFQVEASVATPGDIGEAQRRSGPSVTLRAQGYYKSLVVGVSRISSEPYASTRFAFGRLTFTGADVRWSKSGVSLRGEFIHGRPWTRPQTTGWYADATLHRPFMGPITAVYRVEQLIYSSPSPFRYGDRTFTDWRAHRQTIGARVRLPGGFTTQVGVMRQSALLATYDRTALDFAVTYSVRRDQP